jgi:formylglycine-generating enzyme required for sulfatase activity
MVGNVLEWTRSAWRETGQDEPPVHPGGRAARFSYFGSHEKWLRCAARGGLFAYGRDANIGFRVAIVPESK